MAKSLVLPSPLISGRKSLLFSSRFRRKKEEEEATQMERVTRVVGFVTLILSVDREIDDEFAYMVLGIANTELGWAGLRAPP